MITFIALTMISPMTSPDFKFSDQDKVVQTASGLKYADTKLGKGAAVKAGYIAYVHYTLHLDDGKEIDSSRKPGRTPFNFLVGAKQVIAGWDEGLIGVAIGGRRKLCIPPQLGYGEAGKGEIIPGNSTLWFDVELMATTAPAEFLPTEKPKDQQGVKVLDLLPGEGQGAKKGEQVAVMYSLFAPDGKLIERGIEPLQWTIGDGSLIKGFDAGAIGLKKGGARKVMVPPSLGYGAKGVGPIGPNQTLWFLLERL